MSEVGKSRSNSSAGPVAIWLACVRRLWTTKQPYVGFTVICRKISADFVDCLDWSCALSAVTVHLWFSWIGSKSGPYWNIQYLIFVSSLTLENLLWVCDSGNVIPRQGFGGVHPGLPKHSKCGRGGGLGGKLMLCALALAKWTWG